MVNIKDTFAEIINPYWKVSHLGSGAVIRRPASLHLSLMPTQDEDIIYQSAQLTNYDAETGFTCKPPLRLTIDALASLHPSNMKGTMGFGFWNGAINSDHERVDLPQTLWFYFTAPPSHVSLTPDIAPTGWKASMGNAKLGFAKRFLPFIQKTKIRFFKRLFWRIGQRNIRIQEVVLDADLLTQPHRYIIEWYQDRALFYVDDDLVQTVENPPQDALGFVAWMDNRTIILTPEGKYKVETTHIKRAQALMLSMVHLESLDESTPTEASGG